jgi:hypothetical protein
MELYGAHEVSYAPPGSDEADAQMYRQDYLPPADDLAETGGRYELLDSIQSPKVTPKQDPWMDPRSYLDY